MSGVGTILGIDIGGTKIATGLVDATSPTKVYGHVTAPTPKSDVMDAVLPVIDELCAKAAQHGNRQVTGIGIGAPGVIDPRTGTVMSAGPTMPGWAGTEIKAIVEKHTGLPTVVANDVRVMGLGESRFGAGRHYESVLFVSLGTGVGGALVRGGALVDSPHCTAGELRGLIARSVTGGACIVEEMAAGPGLAATYNRMKAASTSEKKEEKSEKESVSTPAHTPLDLRHIMARYDEDELARTVIEQSMINLGECLAGFASAIDVDAMVIGGGVGNIGERILTPLRRGFRTHALSPMDTIDIVQAELRHDAPIIGAASLMLA